MPNQTAHFMKKYWIAVLFIVGMQNIQGQSVFQHISNTSIYEFLDEMANLQIISLNSAIKPYSRQFIAQSLSEIQRNEHLLNMRQKKELNFYLKDFNKELKRSRFSPRRFDLFYYSDSIFLLSASPVFGVNYFVNNNGSAYHRWNGGEAFAYIGNNFGFYASLRDNFESQRISDNTFLTQRIGGAYKNRNEYSEMRGGISFTNNWLSIGMVKDHFTWGNNYNGANIFSERAPSFGQIKIKIRPVTWFEFNYVHAWLASGVIDSLSTYTIFNGDRIVYRPKHLVANMFTLTPIKRLNISFGNSMVYSDIGFNPAYIIPVFFFKSVDHTYVTSNYGGQNAQMFFNISSRQLNRFHFYVSGFIDEISINNMFNKNMQTNYYSIKTGLKTSNFLADNTSFTIEFTRTNPAVFQHIIETTTFESSGYNMGHYLRDNSREIYLEFAYKPIRGLKLELFYMHAIKGDEYGLQVAARRGLQFMENVEWENTTIGFRGNYQLVNDGFLWAHFIHSNITGNVEQYTPGLFHGKTFTVSAGFNWGF